MTFLPIVVRELRLAARKPSTYYLRTLGAAAVIAAIVVFAFNLALEAGQGGQLFAYIHLALWCAIWGLAPFMSADCLSRERREGTLGLLLLTRLTASDIVLAKGLAHALRSATVWLAAVPVVTICFLLGGVGWHEIVLSILVNFSALCLALGAGLLASSLCRRWTRALVLAGCFSVVLCLLLAVCLNVAVITSLGMFRRFVGAPWPEWIAMGLYLATDQSACWSSGRINTRWLWSSAGVSLGSFLCLLLIAGCAAWRVLRVWREEPPSARLVWLGAKFCRPVIFRSVFHRWMRYCLAKNPIGWLEQRRWSARLVTWCWLGVAACFTAITLIEPQVSSLAVPSSGYQVAIAFLLGSLTLSAAASFRRERETGVLELLLVSPLSTGAIISGRLRGLWIQFLPAMALLLGIWCYLLVLFGPAGFYQPYSSWSSGYYRSYHPYDPVAPFFDVLYYAIAFLTAPGIGLYFSLRCRNFISAYAASILIALVAPWVMSILLIWGRPGAGFAASPDLSEAMASVPALIYQIFFQVTLGAIFYGMLWSRLRSRTFPLERSVGA
jgi:ABC-type transport system involved in cytochrome c biogenesis permease component